MKFSELDYAKLSDEDMYHLVMDGIIDYGKYEPTEKTKSDMIIVLGCSPIPLKARTLKMMELYKKGYSKNILFSGGKGWQSIIEKEPSKKPVLLKAIKDTISPDLLGDNPTEEQKKLYDRFNFEMEKMLGSSHKTLTYEESQEAKKMKMTEEQFMRLIMLSNGGLPGAKIFHEPFSTNTKENIANTRKLIEGLIKNGEINNLSRAMIVTSSFHCRRTYLTFKKYFDDIEILTAPATYDLESKGIALNETMVNDKYYGPQIKAECKKIIDYIRNGSIEDMEVSNIMQRER